MFAAIAWSFKLDLLLCLHVHWATWPKFALSTARLCFARAFFSSNSLKINMYSCPILSFDAVDSGFSCVAIQCACIKPLPQFCSSVLSLLFFLHVADCCCCTSSSSHVSTKHFFIQSFNFGCLVWSWLKLPCEVVSIMIRINMFRSWFAQCTAWRDMFHMWSD